MFLFGMLITIMRHTTKVWKPVTVLYRKMSSTKNVIAVCQMMSKNNKNDNLETCKRLVQNASQRGAKVVFLPEACDYIGESKAETLSLAEPLDGPLIKEYRDIAKKYNVWLSLGGIHERVNDMKVKNSHVFINSEGDIVAVYHKTHLFDIELPEKNIRLKESDYVIPGKEIVSPVSSPVGNIGLSVDMRFPELGIALRNMGANILTYPSAFTYNTGAAHWEVLLRARAIENQCYVVAAAQTGVHNRKRSSWGHAMIVDPWGTVISQSSEGENVVTASIDNKLVEGIRASMPVQQHRRYDLYPQLSIENKINVEPCERSYQFGQSSIKADQIFHQTTSTIAFTNKRCVLPGHVLVATKRCAKRLVDLEPCEVSDLFVVVADVQKAVECMYNASSSTICVQDGVHAGQTVEHVHVHVIPRREGDFARNDDIYAALKEHDKETRQERSEMEMSQEATELRKYFI